MSRDRGYDTQKVLFGCLAVVLVVATLSMVITCTNATIPYDSAQAGQDLRGGIPAGSARAVPVRLSNGGLLPVVVFLDAPGSATLGERTVVLGPRGSATVNVTITAPATPGRYEQRIVQHRDLGILPVWLLRPLDALDPWVAIGAVDAFLGVLLETTGRVLLGRGRLRFREYRERPLEVSVRRYLRKLYR